jgi:uncharacterized phage protein (TIGR02218 family)
MRRVDKQLVSLTINRTHCRASLWEISRLDGQIFRFTDHDVPIVYEGDTYVPDGSGLVASAREHNEGIDAQNLDIRGAVTSDSITHQDLFAGLFRGARVVETVVDWRFPWAGKFLTASFILNNTTFDGKKWTADLLSLPMLLNANVGHNYLRTCRWREFGDFSCGVDVDAISLFGQAVTSVLSEDRVFETDVVGLDDQYNFGFIVWTVGNNAGVSSEIKLFEASAGTVSLQLETPYTIQVGDEFTIRPGCDRTKESCITYNNLKRFGGYPEIPGNDKLFTTPDA